MTQEEAVKVLREYLCKIEEICFIQTIRFSEGPIASVRMVEFKNAEVRDKMFAAFSVMHELGKSSFEQFWYRECERFIKKRRKEMEGDGIEGKGVTGIL